MMHRSGLGLALAYTKCDSRILAQCRPFAYDLMTCLISERYKSIIIYFITIYC